MQVLMGAGVLLYGALSLTGLFVMGLGSGDRIVMLLAIASAGVAYVAQLLAFAGGDRMVLPNAAVSFVSVALGVAAFVRLLT